MTKLKILIMSKIYRCTALKKEWQGKIQPGETFTVTDQYPFDMQIRKQLNDMGRNILSSSSIHRKELKVGESDKTNNWLVERIA